MELVVLFAAFKYFLVEGGEQFIVGFQTSKKAGLKPTIKITIFGAFFTVILFLLFFHYRFLIHTNILELILGLTLYYFSFRMFREVIIRERDDYDDGSDSDGTKQQQQQRQHTDYKDYKYGYIYLVILESIENSSALAALTFVDISGALVGAAVSIVLFIIFAMKSKQFFEKIPINKMRLTSGILLVLTATPLIVYSSGLPAPRWMQWIIPPLD